MDTKNMLKDKFLKKMIKQGGLDQPSDHFTKNIMEKIQVESVSIPEKSQPVIETKYWILIGAGLAVASFVLFGTDWSFMESILGFFKFNNVELPAFSLNFIDTFKSLFAGIQIPSIVFIAIFAIGSLIAIDRILHKKANTVNIFIF